MPIYVGAEREQISEDVFKEIAYLVTGVAFSVHNDYGSLFAEKVYRHEVAARCRKMGLQQVETEVPVHVAHDSFAADYFIDLLVSGGALFELKNAAALTDAHRGQALNYLLLTELRRARLLNFGTLSVQHEFVSTTLTAAERRRFFVHRDRWRALDAESVKYHELMIDLLNDWGGFLSLPLYYKGIMYFFGGEDNVVHDIPVVREGVNVTTQKVHLLNQAIAFKITAFPRPLEAIEQHLRCFLHHTLLEAIQWVNLDHHDVTFTTLIRGD